MGTVLTSEQSTFDEGLMLKVRDEDCRESFEELFARWKGRIHRLVYRMTGSYSDADDLVQEIFARLYRSRKTYVGRGRFEAFFWKIAVNKTRDFARKAGRTESRHSNLEYLQTADRRACHEREFDERDQVQQAIVRLPDQHREVLVLRHFECLSFAEIANLLNVPQGTVASRMARALVGMKEILTKENEKYDNDNSPET